MDKKRSLGVRVVEIFVATISIIGLWVIFCFIQGVANFNTALILSCSLLFLFLPGGIGISSGKSSDWARKLALVGLAVLLTVIFYFVVAISMFRNGV